MKKISSLIVCLTVLTIGTAFALDLPDALKIPGLTVTGDVRTGLRVDGGTIDNKGENDVFGSGPAGAQDPAVYAHSDDLDDGTPFRAQLQLVWERDKLGVKTRFRYRPDGAGKITSTIDPGGFETTAASELPGTVDQRLALLNATVNKAFVYGKLLDDKVRVSAGKGLDEAWALFYSSFANAAGSGNTGGFDGKDGVKIEVKPIPGLNLGAFYGTGNLFGKAYKPGSEGPFIDWSENDRRLAVGAKYTSKLFSVVAATTHNFVEPDVGVNSYDGRYAINAAGNIDGPIPGTSNLLVGLRVNPIEPLQIDLSFAAVNLGSKTVKAAFGDGEDMPNTYKKGDFNPYWAAWLKFKAAYAVNDKLGVALDIYDISFADSYYYDETFTGSSGSIDDYEGSGLGNLFPITISPSATYALTDDITAGVALGYNINSGGSDQFGFGFKPSAEFSLGSGATFVVWDELTFWAQSNDDVDFLLKHPSLLDNHQGGNKGASGTTNTLQFDFVWTF
jgi:hypothetical protein